MYDFWLRSSLWQNDAGDKESMFVAQYLVILRQRRTSAGELIENNQARGKICWKTIWNLIVRACFAWQKGFYVKCCTLAIARRHFEMKREFERRERNTTWHQISVIQSSTVRHCKKYVWSNRTKTQLLFEGMKYWERTFGGIAAAAVAVLQLTLSAGHWRCQCRVR